jgi:hypothetical protein
MQQARCLTAAVEATSARFPLTSNSGAVLHGNLSFPLDAAGIDREVEALRRRLQPRKRPPTP